MSEPLSGQLYIFLIYCLCGIIIGILFDIFRILRKSFKTPDIVTYIQDVTFWLLTGIFLIYIIFKFNNGEIRSYIFIGLVLGVAIYLLIFSKVFIKVNTIVIRYLKIIIGYPIRWIITAFDKILLNNTKKLKNLVFMYVGKGKILNKLKKNKDEKKDFKKICRR